MVTAKPVTESDRVHAGSTVRVGVQLTIAPDLHAQSNHPRDPSLIPMALFIDAPAGVKYVDVAFPPSTEFRTAGYDEPLAVFTGEVLIGARLEIGSDVAPGPLAIPGRLRYQACDEKMCYPPRTAALTWTVEVVPRGQAVAPANRALFTRIDFAKAEPPVADDRARSGPVVATGAASSAKSGGDLTHALDDFQILGTSAYMTTGEFLTFVHDAETGNVRRGAFEGRGPLAILAIVFLGGLALNLTPCVLPMIPINLAIIGAGAQAARRSRGFLLGSAYGAAMALVYGVLGLVVILTAGTFGTINASVWFNVAIAALFVVLGLAMFDVFSLDLSRWSSRIQFSQQSRGTVWLAFGMGAVAALLAGACVAPVVVQVVVFASNLYAGGTSIALALPFLLGLGMAIPWPIAGAGIASLPRPGAWMVRVKQVLGVFILATAAYYGYLAYEIVSSRWVDPASVKASVDEQLKQGWYASLPDGLQAARRDGKLVLIDFWATWCKNCLVMDKTTLQDPAVKQALSNYVRIKFQAEAPDESPAKELLQKVGGVGLPTYVILKKK
jgi:thiol:disulfide interchange protein